MYSKDKTALVRCKGGINRSTIVVIAYLCKRDQFSIQEAGEGKDEVYCN